MAYAERVKSPKGNYWRGRYQDPHGKYVSVRDEHSRVIRFTGKREALKAADDAEADVRSGRWRDPNAGAVTFAEWADSWYAGLDLAPSTMANRKRHLEDYLLHFFGDMTLRAIEEAGPPLITKWEREMRARGYADASIKTWRGTLHIVLEDARGKHITINPATMKKGRGRRSGRRAVGRQGTEKTITTPLGVFLVAERMSILTGRDDEFVMVQTAFWQALRIGELIGLEKPYVRQKTLRAEWQLSEVEGDLIRCAPKDDSQGDTVMAPFMRRLLDGHMRRVPPQRCPCHGQPYVFRGYGAPKSRWNRPLRDLAALAGIPEHTVRQALNGTRPVSEEMRWRVREAADRFGFERGDLPGGPAWHWRRSAFEGFFTAAASGWFPPRGGQALRPVLLDASGTRLRGPRQEERAALCWAPVAAGLTPHSLRHSAKTMMEERRVPEIMSETQMRHVVGGVSGIYRHVTAAMRGELADMMTREWEAVLDARLEMSPGSPVGVVEGLLRERLQARRPAIVPSDSPGMATNVVPLPGRTHDDQPKREIQ